MTSAAVVGVVMTAAFAVAASASPPPQADTGLIGTWTNETATGAIVLTRLVIASNGAGGLTVDSFGACGAPKVCEYGKVPALVFGTAANSTTGGFFKTNQQFATYNKILLGHLIATSAGPRIVLQRYATYRDASRYNAALTYRFKRINSSTSGTRTVGTATTAYPTGKPPTPTASLLGVWHNTNVNTGGFVELDISSGGAGGLLIHAFGNCSPNPCDLGTFPGITYGASSGSPTGSRFLAPHNAGFKLELFTGQAIASNGTLRVDYYSQFTDSSGRSNYALSDTFSH